MSEKARLTGDVGSKGCTRGSTSSCTRRLPNFSNQAHLMEVERRVCNHEHQPGTRGTLLSPPPYPFPRPDRQERWALHCLYKSTNGPGWACDDGWANLFEGSVSSIFGVAAEKGRVTKISLGMNNMEGLLSDSDTMIPVPHKGC